MFPCESAPKVQRWSKIVQQEREDCLTIDHMPSLPEEPYINLTYNDIFDLVTIWGQICRVEKESFCKKNMGT